MSDSTLECGGEGFSVVDHEIHFQEDRDSLRVALAQLSPAYDPDLWDKKSIVKVKNPDVQAQKILKVIQYAGSREADVLIFPELVAPFQHLKEFEDAVGNIEGDFVTNICFEHTFLSDLISLLSEEEIEQHDFVKDDLERKLVNFCRILIKRGSELHIFTQIKLTPFSTEFSLSAKDTMHCGKILHRFITNRGNFLFLICKDYVGEVRKEGKVPMFDFLKSLTPDGLHYIFVSSLNPEPEAFIHAARAFYYLQEKSSHTFTVILNTAELANSAIVFPLRPHPKIRSPEEVELLPLFENKPSWGTYVRYPGPGEKIIIGTCERLDRYRPLATKEIFSPFYWAKQIELSELGIKPDVPVTKEKPVEEKEAEKAAPKPTQKLPTQQTPFLGREEELDQVIELIEDPSCRLITVIGPGGVGKTRLALRAAEQKIDEFPNGVYFIPLAPVSSLDLLVSAFADALEFSFSDDGDPKDQLLDYLREKEMFLVVDNFEHLTGGANLLSEILEFSPNLQVLTTSRERLNLKGEWVYELSGLPIPESLEIPDFEDYSSVKLFLQSAKRSQPGFTLTEEKIESVIRICELVEGMPLGIELAAASIRLLSCEEIAKEIEKNLGFLVTTLRDVPKRHRSMQAVFDHSWRLLSDSEKKTFRKLSVFPAGFTREAAEKVAEVPLPLFSALIDKSMLKRTSSGRYEILEVLRQYAEEKLHQNQEEREKVLNLCSDYYAEFLNNRGESLKGEKQQKAVEEIREEIDNIRMCWEWSVKSNKLDEIEKFLEPLYHFYEMRGRSQEGEEAFGKVGEEFEKRVEIGELTPKEESIWEKILARQGWFCTLLGSYGKADELLGRSLDMARNHDNRREMGFSLDKLGVIALEQGEYEEAKQLLEESLELNKEAGNRRGESSSINNLGVIALEQGEYSKAKQLIQKSLTISKEVGNRKRTASYLNNLGVLAIEQGNYGEAKRLFEDSLTIHKEIGDRRGVSFCLGNLGIVAKLREEYKEAKKDFQEGLAISQDIGNRWATALFLNHLGEASFALGEYERAKDLLQESLAIGKDTGNQRVVCLSLGNLGELAKDEGKYQESKSYFENALNTAMDIQVIPVVLEILIRIASLLVDEGRNEKALAIVAFSLNHSAINMENKKRAKRLFSKLKSDLPSDTIQAIKQKAESKKLEDIVEEISIEIKENSDS